MKGKKLTEKEKAQRYLQIFEFLEAMLEVKLREGFEEADKEALLKDLRLTRQDIATAKRQLSILSAKEEGQQ